MKLSTIPIESSYSMHMLTTIDACYSGLASKGTKWRYIIADDYDIIVNNSYILVDNHYNIVNGAIY